MQHFARVQRIAELTMSGRASGGAVKRQREQAEGDDDHEEGEEEPECLEATAHPMLPILRRVPLALLAAVKSCHGMLVWAQLCNPQGVALFSFVRLAPRAPRPFAGAAVLNDMKLTYGERLRVVGCGLKGKLVRLLSLGTGCHFEPQRNRSACHRMMHSTVRRVASKPMVAVRDEAVKEADELCASGQYAAAAVALKLAVDLGHFPSRALKAWLLVNGREGVAKDEEFGFELAEEGARLGCHHCQGVVALCYWRGCGCERDAARSLELARESSGRGSRYGQLVLGSFYSNDAAFYNDRAGVLALEDYAQAAAFYRLAAAQGLDDAQYVMGIIYYNGFGVVGDDDEAHRWQQLAKAQGHPEALFDQAEYHDSDLDDVAEAVRWYRRAQAAGYRRAADELRRLRAEKPFLF
jgi:TPR repeat protein